MKVNEKTAVATDKVLLVPYEAHHVAQYHDWMQDPATREATASEPLSLAEEYENQESWRRAEDKLTFIVCESRSEGDGTMVSKATETIRGDVNLILHGDTAEVDVMIGEAAHRGRGLGSGAVRALLAYVRRHEDEVLGRGVRRLVRAKIKQDNAVSRTLFQSLVFVDEGGVDCFGERTLVVGWDEVCARVDGEWFRADGYRELVYCA